jgi:hypothetical protein
LSKHTQIIKQKICMQFYLISYVQGNLVISQIGLDSEPLHEHGGCLGGVGEKGVTQELSGSPSVAGLLVQTACDEAPEMGRRCWRRRRGIPITDCAHQGWPVGLLPRRQKREMLKKALQQTQPRIKIEVFIVLQESCSLHRRV